MESPGLDESDYTVAVRELCEFAAKTGDLDLRFTPSPNAQEGIAGHQLVASRRGQSYRSEVNLTGRYKQLVVRGRADGYSAEQNLLEECKTFKGELERMPANHRALHWAQAKVYGWLLCQQMQLAELTVSLVYFEINSKQETSLFERYTAVELQQFSESLFERFLAWAKAQLEHRRHRDLAMIALRFPHQTFRSGQRAMAESVFRAARRGRCLMAQAPTGIGKTIATIFPMLKASPEQQLDKIFFLSAKGTGRELALQAIQKIRDSQPELPLRLLELVARNKACEHPDKACHGESCPLASGFYDRLPAARGQAIANPALTREVLREIALEHSVCPYYLSQELVRWSDVIIGDYNYYFDSGAMLHTLTLANQWRVAVLVDEAHNLIDRARAMYSAELSQSEFRSLRRCAPSSLKLPFARLSRAWNAISKSLLHAYQAQDQLPARFIGALQAATQMIGDQLTDSGTQPDGQLLRFYFDASTFMRIAESYGEHSIFDLQKEQGNNDPKPIGDTSLLSIRNVVPASFLRTRFQTAHTSVLFSATLSPSDFYAETLGLPENATFIEVASPFEAKQLDVHIVSNISTRFHQRARSLEPIAKLIAKQFNERPGNYLAFFSSFDYLQPVAQVLSLMNPEIPVWQQSRGMDEAGRARFLSQFTAGGRGIGFAVLGGVFAEGIDLPGSRLIGAFVATLGLPQINPVNEAMKRRIDASLGKGKGYDYIYLFPGLRKIVQASGRVIRTSTDQGSLFLIDDRFDRPEVRPLLPAWWFIKTR